MKEEIKQRIFIILLLASLVNMAIANILLTSRRSVPTYLISDYATTTSVVVSFPQQEWVEFRR